MKEYDQFYDSTKWKRIRSRVLRRDGYTCQESKRYTLNPVAAEVVHHVFPREQFPEWQYCMWNLISLSRNAHNEMHDRATDQLTPKGIALAKRVGRKNGIDVEKALQRITPPQKN